MLCTDNEGFGSDESMEEDPAGESDFDANQGVSLSCMYGQVLDAL